MSTFRKRLLLAGLIALGVWLTFFDSHSLLRRIGWEHERATLHEENRRLEAEIATLETRLGDIDDTVIEQIAREQYGMRRPGETVYRVQEE